MVFLHSLHYVLSISSCSLFLMMLMMMMSLVFAAPTKTGFTLKLIHRDSPKSPHYRGNLTKLERLERSFQQSKHRERKLLSTWQMKGGRNNSTTTNNNSESDTDMILPGVKDYDGYTYMVELGIGTFSSKGGKPSYYDFYFDTGSDLLWLQCDATRTGTTETKYFKQNEKIFNDGEYSLTYNPLPYNSPNRICQKYVRLGVPPEGSGKDFCGYSMGYADDSGTEGVLATEKISVISDNGHDEIEEINDFVFGCGYRQNEPEFGQHADNPIAGILGLGRGQESFVSQLGDRIDNRFEYCLKPWFSDHESPTLLRFGYNTKIVVGGPDVQTTATLPVRGNTLYYVTMTGISIGNDPVVYPDGSNVFVAKQDGTGGCIFDTGTESTTLSEEVYVPFKKQLVDSLFKINITRRSPPREGKLKNYDLCFKLRNKNLPRITFHFDEGADFVMDQPQSLFDTDKDRFCLMIRKSEETKPLSVILGATQQANHRILHDNKARTISWVHDICDLE